MNRFLIGAGIAALVAVPALALQHGAHSQRPDGSTPVTRAEVQAQIQQRFAAIDTNRDGAITKTEIDGQRERMKLQRQAGRAEHRSGMFAVLDADRNGQLSRQEFMAERRAGGAADRPGGRDGHGGGHGFGRGRHMDGPMRMGGISGERWLERLDADKDGRLTLAEATAKPLAMFDQADTNNDGTVTPEERQAARGMFRKAWNAVRG